MKTTLKIFAIIFTFIAVTHTDIYAQGYRFSGKYAPISKDVTRFSSSSSFTPASTFRSVGTPEWLIAKGVVKRKNWAFSHEQGNMKSNYPWWTVSKQVTWFNRK